MLPVYYETLSIEAMQSELSKANPNASVIRGIYESLLNSNTFSNMISEQVRDAVMRNAETVLFGERGVTPENRKGLEEEILRDLSREEAADKVYDIFKMKYGQKKAARVKNALLDLLPSVIVELRFDNRYTSASLVTTFDRGGEVRYDFAISANVGEIVNYLENGSPKKSVLSEKGRKLEQDIADFQYPGHTLTKVPGASEVYYIDKDPSAVIEI